MRYYYMEKGFGEQLGKWLVGFSVQFVDLVLNEQRTFDQVTEQSALIAIMETEIIGQLGGLADIVEKQAGEHQVGVQVGILG